MIGKQFKNKWRAHKHREQIKPIKICKKHLNSKKLLFAQIVTRKPGTTQTVLHFVEIANLKTLFFFLWILISEKSILSNYNYRVGTVSFSKNLLTFPGNDMFFTDSHVKKVYLFPWPIWLYILFSLKKNNKLFNHFTQS